MIDAVAGAEGVVAGVFAQEGGQQPGGEISVVGLIEEAAPGVGVEAAHPFAEGGMFVESFGGEGGETEKDEGGIIDGLVGGDGEVVFPAGRVGLESAGDGAEIGHEAEDALGLAAFEGDEIAVGVDRVFGAGFGGGVWRGGGGRPGSERRCGLIAELSAGQRWAVFRAGSAGRAGRVRQGLGMAGSGKAETETQADENDDTTQTHHP